MIARAERLAGVLGEDGRVVRRAGPVADRLEDRAQVADRDALAQQVLQHALHLADAELVGDDLLDHGGVLLLERVEQLACVSWRVSSSSAWRRIVSVRCVTIIDSASTTV